MTKPDSKKKNGIAAPPMRSCRSVDIPKICCKHTAGSQKHPMTFCTPPVPHFQDKTHPERDVKRRQAAQALWKVTRKKLRELCKRRRTNERMGRRGNSHRERRGVDALRARLGGGGPRRRHGRGVHRQPGPGAGLIHLAGDLGAPARVAAEHDRLRVVILQRAADGVTVGRGVRERGAKCERHVRDN